MSEVSAPDKNVLRVEDLVMYFRTQHGAVRAVDPPDDRDRGGQDQGR